VVRTARSAGVRATRCFSFDTRAIETGRRFGMLVMEPGSLVMERKTLLGIKDRAESQPSSFRSP
jgi:hypothetical protein